MKNIIILIITFSLSSCLHQQKNTQGIFKQIVDDQEYEKMNIYAWSFTPELTDSLKNDENFKFTMKEVKEEDFSLYYKAKKYAPQINWKNYKSKSKITEIKDNNILQISTPLFIRDNQEALIQIKTFYKNEFNVYKYKNGKWILSYSFGNRIKN